MNDLSCTWDLLAGLKEARDRAPDEKRDVNDALQEAIDATCLKINEAFARQEKVRARLRA